MFIGVKPLHFVCFVITLISVFAIIEIETNMSIIHCCIFACVPAVFRFREMKMFITKFVLYKTRLLLIIKNFLIYKISLNIKNT